MSLRPPLPFNTRPRRLSTPTDAYEIHPDIIIIFQSENYGITTPSSKIPRSAPKKERTTEKDALQQAQAKEHISSQVERMARSSSYYAPDIYAPSC